LTENLKQCRVRDEKESRKNESLTFQISAHTLPCNDPTRKHVQLSVSLCNLRLTLRSSRYIVIISQIRPLFRVKTENQTENHGFCKTETRTKNRVFIRKTKLRTEPNSYSAKSTALYKHEPGERFLADFELFE